MSQQKGEYFLPGDQLIDDSTRPRSPLPTDLDLEILLKFDPVTFSDRYDYMQHLTAGYGGNLASTWQTHTQIDALDRTSLPKDDVVSTDHDRELNNLVRLVMNSGVPSVIIEAAHVYMYENLDDPELVASILTQAEHARRLTVKLRESGIIARQMLFVDDYNPPVDGREATASLNLDRLLELVTSAGYHPEVLLREGSMVPLAQEMIDVIVEQKLAAPQKTRTISDGIVTESERLLLHRHNVELYRSGDDMVSCAMLDAALTLVKLEYLGQGVINVLPRGATGQDFSYKGQQEKMRTIIGEHMNSRVLPSFNLFTGVSLDDPISAGGHHTLRKKSKPNS